jgi:pimeloyl-ACP methyl ester carboxylesterase
MTRFKIFSVVLIFAMILSSLCACNRSSAVYDEGSCKIIKQTTWQDTDKNTHNANFYTHGKTASEVSSDSPDITLNHIFIDDIPVYEMYSKNNNSGKVLFLFHGQGSRKEEYLYEMLNYVDAGYLCVAVDLRGHGERLIDGAVMSVELTVGTARDIDTLLEYYHTVSYANIKTFALLGLSQGGSVCYWYAAYGKRTPSAMIVGSSTPDYKYQNDTIALKNGETIDSIWSDEQFNDFINQNNPINEIDKLINIPILAGNGLSDNVVSYKGSESLEKAKIDAGHVASQFFYFENIGHEVTEAFMMKALPFLNKTLIW